MNTPKPLAVSRAEAGRLLSRGSTRIDEMIAAGVLRSIKDGRSRLIIYASIEDYVRRKLAERDEDQEEPEITEGDADAAEPPPTVDRPPMPWQREPT